MDFDLENCADPEEMAHYEAFNLHCLKKYLFSGFWSSNGISLLELCGSVVECLTRDRRAVGLSLTGVTAMWSLSKTHLS